MFQTMTQNVKKYLIGVVCALVAMFLWIFMAVALTGGRDVEEFTQTDKIIMTCFLVVEVVTVIAALTLAVLLGNAYGKNLRQNIRIPETREEKRSHLRGLLLLLLAWLISLGTMIGGILLRTVIPSQLHSAGIWVSGGCLLVAVLALLFNMALKRLYIRRFQKQQVAQFQAFVHSHRTCARETAAKKLSLLKVWRAVTSVYACVLFGLGICISLCGGLAFDTGSSTAFCLVGVVLIMCAFARIRFSVSKAVFEDDKAYVSQQQYPQIYALAQKAAGATGCDGEIRIAFLANCNAGIAKIGQCYSVQIGVILLRILSQEELYCVLLHEFAHMTEQNRSGLKEQGYHAWLSFGKTAQFLSGITSAFFEYFDAVYLVQFILYDYASSIQIEEVADRAMLLCDTPGAAASSLMKLKYYELFCWEKGTVDEPCIYTDSKPIENPVSREADRFFAAIDQNCEKWNGFIDIEIQSRSATHPTLRNRLTALGVQQLRLFRVEAAPAYTQEVRSALAYVDGLVLEDVKSDYEACRKAYYLDPLTQVETWEAAGRPVIAEEYGDIIWALRQLGRNTEVVALCDEAIGALDVQAACNAYFIRGCFRLHSYDPAGISDIYTAVANNSNYMQEGIDAIGAFCCLTGNQEELEVYREKAVMYAQQYKDMYSQMGVLDKKDRLSPESLPDGLLDDILDFVRSVDSGQIEKIYLVRKTITEDFFTSVFVIRFALDADSDACNEIMHKVFQYLDTCSDWQFSLFNFEDVMQVPVYKIENSCVYRKRNSQQ